MEKQFKHKRDGDMKRKGGVVPLQALFAALVPIEVSRREASLMQQKLKKKKEEEKKSLKTPALPLAPPYGIFLQAAFCRNISPFGYIA